MKKRGINVFSSILSKQREKSQKQPLGAPTDLVYKIRHGGVYFAKIDCKIEGATRYYHSLENMYILLLLFPEFICNISC